MAKQTRKSVRNVFVYGTLRQDQVSTHLLHGYRLYDLGPFPCIIPAVGCEGVVYGNLLTNVTDRELATLDRVEGVARGFYTRESVRVFDVLHGTYPQAYVYVAGNVIDEATPMIEVVSGDWHRHPRKQRKVFSPYN